jgi:hypothetical protein
VRSVFRLLSPDGAEGISRASLLLLFVIIARTGSHFGFGEDAVGFHTGRAQVHTTDRSMLWMLGRPVSAIAI